MYLLKETLDRNSYLLYQSFHPSHLKDNIPYSHTASCYISNVILQQYRTGRGTGRNLFTSFLKKDIWKGLLLQQKTKTKKRAERLESWHLFRTKVKQSNKNITSAIQYPPLVYKIKCILQKHWHLVQELPGSQLCPDTGLTRTRNIKDILI